MSQTAGKIADTASAAGRLEGLDWKDLSKSLDELGFAVTAPILSETECASVMALYGDESRFRSHVVMVL